MQLSGRLTVVLAFLVLASTAHTETAYAQEGPFPISVDPCVDKGRIHIGSSVARLDEWDDVITCLKQWRDAAQGANAPNTRNAPKVNEAWSGAQDTLPALGPLGVHLADETRGQSIGFLYGILFLPPILLLFVWLPIGIRCYGWPDMVYQRVSALARRGKLPGADTSSDSTPRPSNKGGWRSWLLVVLPLTLSVIVVCERLSMSVTNDVFYKSPGQAWYACLENRSGSPPGRSSVKSIENCVESEYGKASFPGFLLEMVAGDESAERTYIAVWIVLLVSVLISEDLNELAGYGKKSGHEASWRLRKVGVVLLCYVSCGVAFGMLYFDCAATTVQRRNAFLVDAAVFARSTIRNEIDPLVAPDVRDKYKLEEPAWGKRYFDLKDVSAYLSLNRQSVDAIAEDTPRAEPSLSHFTRLWNQIEALLLFDFKDSQMPRQYLILYPEGTGRQLTGTCPSGRDGSGSKVGNALAELLKAYPRKSGTAVEFEANVYGWADRNVLAGGWRENALLAQDRAKTCWGFLRNAVNNPAISIDAESRRELLRKVDAAKPRSTDFTQNSSGSLPSDFWDVFEGTQWKDVWAAGCPRSIFGILDAGSRSAEEVGNSPVTDQLWRSCAAQLRILEPDPEIDSTLVARLTSKLTLVDTMYFSFATFTTTGFGDIRPVSGPVRLLCTIENILELLFTSLFFVSAFNIR